MRNIQAIFQLALSLMVAQIVVAAPHESERVVTLAGDPWPPYVLGEMGNEATGGLGLDLMQAIFERIDGVSVSMPLVPWNRALREVKRGSKDGIGVLIKTAEREQYMEYSDEVFRSVITIWYSSKKFPDGFNWQKYGDLKPYNIGVIHGHSHGEELDQMIADGHISVTEVPSSGNLFAMLEKGRVDLVLADLLVGSSFVKHNDNLRHKIYAARKPAAVEIFFIAFSKNSTAVEYLPAVNQAIREMQQQGAIEQIFGRIDTTLNALSVETMEAEK